MSYCRWSSDDHQCDVYVYKDSGGGWMTHVAKARPVFAEELPPPVDPEAEDWAVAWVKRVRVVHEMLDRATRTVIGLPHDGCTFNDDTPGECADRLEELRSLGYRVPQYAIDDLRQESRCQGCGSEEGSDSECPRCHAATCEDCSTDLGKPCVECEKKDEVERGSNE